MADGVAGSSGQDRWNTDTSAGRVEAPHQIDRFTQGLEHPANAIKDIGLEWRDIEPIHNLRWGASHSVRGKPDLAPLGKPDADLRCRQTG